MSLLLYKMIIFEFILYCKLVKYKIYIKIYINIITYIVILLNSIEITVVNLNKLQM